MTSLRRAHRLVAVAIGMLLWPDGDLVAAGESCGLVATASGQTIRLEGVVRNAGHDLLLFPEGCDDRVVLAMAGDPETDTRKDQLRVDGKLKKLRAYLAKRKKGNSRNPCIACSLYEVETTVTGRLDVADGVGMKQSAEGVTQTDGFGHPMPFTRYRLVLFSVEHLEPRALKP